MSQFPLPPDEQQRLLELHHYRILDTEKEQEFEELAELAAQVAECPVASITFIDQHRQWFKARIGDPSPQGPRDISFCTLTILENEALIVEDATMDQRFAANPDVTGGLGIVFYAGVPVYSARGFKIGTVCVVDHEPRKLSDAQLISLKLISRQVTNLLELRLRNSILKRRNEIMLAESERSFEAYFSGDAQPKWIYETETLRILQVNEPAIMMYGYTRQEFLELSVFDLRDDPEKKHIHQLVRTLNNNSRSLTFETVHRKRNGEKMTVEVTVTNILYKGKKARLATMTDITEKMKMWAQARHEALLLKERMDQAANIAKEEERDHIGKELHDNINQILASTKLYLEIAGSNPEMREDMIRLSKVNIVEAMTEIRALSRSLVAAKDDFSLTYSVEELIKSYRITNIFRVECAYTGYVEELPDDIKLTLFRIIQEAVNNSSKYAKASEVNVSISYTDIIRVIVQDNGQGFDPSARRHGIGFKNIENRVSFYNGKVKIDSAPGRGCKLTVEIPMDGGEHLAAGREDDAYRHVNGRPGKE
ncbi:MAG TPA: ATP-binding protein [Flavisolibacter sp.]|nr:ATP-binding protein [Flavisolibacter sp.]